MADLIKDLYNLDYMQKLGAAIKDVYAPFAVNEFVAATLNERWAGLELKARMRQITENLRKFLPTGYTDAIGVIDKVIVGYGDWLTGFGAMFFPDFVEVYGLAEADWDVSIAALERYTRHASAEFAVRPFIIKDERRMMAQMYAWSKSGDNHVRRLASEGCRPALPWAQALPSFKKDPSPIFPILEELKADPDLYVRKSVANNLNDISKTHPELVIKIVSNWHGKNDWTDWIVKHACRTLLKKGNADALAIFGFQNADAMDAGEFAVSQPTVSIGGSFDIMFTIKAKERVKVRLEYAVDFVKANGRLSRKIFQISESNMKADEIRKYSKNHSFADLSTRKHYPGTHAVTLIVNGVERGTLKFEVAKR
ncbi:MAG: DNA alkylation repair protein [Defluviitaleaceae bacterium]|nr:DNA alkylation repair protein [Defluviitaleaceae bacterium]